MAMTLPNLNNFDTISFNGIMNDWQKFWLSTNPLGTVGLSYNETLRPSIIDAIPTIGIQTNKIAFLTKTGGLRFKRNTTPKDADKPFNAPFPPIKIVSKETATLVEKYLTAREASFDINLTNVPLPSGDIQDDMLLRSLGFFGDVDELHRNALVRLINDFYYRHITSLVTSSNYNVVAGDINSSSNTRNYWESVYTGADNITTLPSLKSAGVDAISTLAGWIAGMQITSRQGITHMMVSLDVARFLFTELKRKAVQVVGNATFSLNARNDFDLRYYDNIEAALSEEFKLRVIINGFMAEDDTGVPTLAMPNGTIVFLNIPNQETLAAYRQRIYWQSMTNFKTDVKLPYTSGIVMLRDTSNHIVNRLEWETLAIMRNQLGLTASRGLAAVTEAMNSEQGQIVSSIRQKINSADFSNKFSNGLLYSMNRANATNLRVDIRMEYSDLIKVDLQSGALFKNVLVSS